MDEATLEPDLMTDNQQKREAARAAGTVRGQFFTEWVVEIKDLIRARRDDEALSLLLECIDASRSWAVADHGGMGAPWYTTAAAGIYRRRKDYQAEASILTSYLAATDGTVPKMGAALRKAEAFLASSRLAELPPACPSCGSIWDTWPAKTITCPDCGAGAVVRKVNGYPKLFSADQDLAHKAESTYGREREKMLVRAGYMGVSEAAWDAKCEVMSSGTMSEVYLQLANEALTAADASGDFVRAHTILWETAKFQAEAGRPWVELMRAAEDRMSTNLWARYPPEQEMIIMGCSCSDCLSRSGRLTVAEYLREAPLPHVECLRPPCRCVFQPVPD